MTDRDAFIARINRAADAGLIGSVDRDIRITNVKHAQSETELQLIARDLDQLEGSLRPAESWVGPPSTAPVPAAQPAGAATVTSPATSPAAGSTAGKVAGIIGCVVVVVVAVTFLVIGIVAFVAIRGATSSSSGGDSAVSGDVEVAEPLVPPYGLDEQGINDFLTTYRDRFDTSQVVELVMYDDYAVVQVPVEGKARSAGWLYRDGKWEDFGGVRASFPGSQPVDTARLDAAALAGNVERARTALGVEEASTTYVVVHDYSVDEPPQVLVYASNEYNESGYLLTRLRGAVVREYPFGG